MEKVSVVIKNDNVTHKFIRNEKADRILELSGKRFRIHSEVAFLCPKLKDVILNSARKVIPLDYLRGKESCFTTDGLKAVISWLYTENTTLPVLHIPDALAASWILGLEKMREEIESKLPEMAADESIDIATYAFDQSVRNGTDYIREKVLDIVFPRLSSLTSFYLFPDLPSLSIRSLLSRHPSDDVTSVDLLRALLIWSHNNPNDKRTLLHVLKNIKIEGVFPSEYSLLVHEARSGNLKAFSAAVDRITQKLTNANEPPECEVQEGMARLCAGKGEVDSSTRKTEDAHLLSPTHHDDNSASTVFFGQIPLDKPVDGKMDYLIEMEMRGNSQVMCDVPLKMLINVLIDPIENFAN